MKQRKDNIVKIKKFMKHTGNTSINHNKKTEKGKFLSTGSTLLNLALSDDIEGGYYTPSIINIIGDSSSGKTLLSYSAMAEAANSEEFKDFRLIKDSAECFDQFDIKNLFGNNLANRIETPINKDKKPTFSKTIEEFHCNVMDAVKAEKPFIYLLDSWDGISSLEDEDRLNFMERSRHKKTGTGEIETKASYKTGKAKMAPEILRKLSSQIRKSGSIIIIISQTRQNFDLFSFEKKKRAGGEALRFYSSVEIWLANEGKIRHKTTKITLGRKTRVIVKKNKNTGKFEVIDFSLPIYFGYGVDDIESMVEFLKRFKVWKISGNSIIANTFNYKGRQDALIKMIDNSPIKLKKLKLAVKNQWIALLKSMDRGRNKRYD